MSKPEAAADWAEAGRKLFAGACEFHLRGRPLGRPAAGRRAGGGLRRAVECRQVFPRQRVDRPLRPRAHVAHARAHAGAHLLRSSWASDARRHAGLRLCRGVESESRRVGRTRARLSARPAHIVARVRARRRPPWPERERPGDDAPARRRRRLLRDRADEGRRSEGQRQKRTNRGDARSLTQARRRLPRGHVHLGPHRRGNRGFARPYRPAPRGAER